MLQKCLKALLSKSAQAQAQAQMLYLKKCLKAPSSTLKNVLKALLSTSTLVLDPCLAVIQQQRKMGIIEKVEHPDEVTSTRVHYLPHHAVLRQDKETTKLRVVYDASAKEEGLSLNECLYTGPKFHLKIFDLLLRF